MEKRLFPLIPFYITRYEKQLAIKETKDTNSSNIEAAINDLEYFKNEMICLHEAGELTDNEWVDLKGFVNNIITHITDGNENEERLVAVMGGELFETESERLMRIGREEGREEGIAFGREEGREEGIAFGREEGIAFGREEGITFGRETANALTVRNLLKRDMPDADIIEIVGCDQNFIDKVRSGQLQPV
jgi:predicted transposase YdaD